MRSDLAVEVGFENLVFVQEIYYVCENQIIYQSFRQRVGESNCGLNRAETSDAIMGQRAKSVMLNNGYTLSKQSKHLEVC